MSALKGPQKAKVFISSLNKYKLQNGTTLSEVRRHPGNPDIHVSKEGWGFFAADPERFIQVGYLTQCLSPRLLIIRVREFFTWLDIYEQVDQLIERAKIRGRILKARPARA